VNPRRVLRIPANTPSATPARLGRRLRHCRRVTLRLHRPSPESQALGMPYAVRKHRTFVIHSPMHRGMRIVLGAVALFPLLAPYELLFRTRWESYLNPFFLFFAAISIGALAVSAGFAANRIRPMEFGGDMGTRAVTAEVIALIDAATTESAPRQSPEPVSAP